MIGQVAALRDAPTTIAGAAPRRERGRHRAARRGRRARPRRRATAVGSMGIAVIGTAALFPGAVGVDEFWANVVGGVDGITEVPAHRWSVDRYYDPEAVVRDAGAKTPSKWGGFLPDVPFDPMRYGIPPRSITSIGNDQLLSLEVAAAALADAGYADRPFDRERTSVVFGAETGTDLAQAYGFRAALPHFVGDVPDALAGIPEAHRGLVPRRAGQRHRRAHRQPARPRRRQLHGRRRLRGVDGRAVGRLRRADLGCERHGAVRRHRPAQRDLRLPAVRGHPRAVAHRPVPHVRRRGRRHRPRRGRRLRRAQAGRRRRARRRPDPGRDRRGGGVQRRAQPRADRPAPRGPAAGARARLRPLGRVARVRSGWSRRTARARWSATAPSWRRSPTCTPSGAPCPARPRSGRSSRRSGTPSARRASPA